MTAGQRDCYAASIDHQPLALRNAIDMMMLNRDGTLTWYSGDERTSGRVKATFEMPANLGAAQRELFEALAAFTLDILGLQAVELRAHTDIVSITSCGRCGDH
jgi:hypothetical protein